MRRIGFVCTVFFLVSGFSPLFSQTDFTRGEDLFMQNKPEEALPYLESTVAVDPLHVKASLYLGIVYQQLERPENAVAVYLKILPRAGTESANVAFNLGNAYFSMGNSESASQYFSQAIQLDPSMSSAWLNRANSRVKTGALREAVSDYEQYLALEPDTPQREEIERLIAFIREEAAAAERRSFEAGDAARIELDRRRRLTEEVSASLQSLADDSRSLSTWAMDLETLEGFDDDFQFEEETSLELVPGSQDTFQDEFESEDPADFPPETGDLFESEIDDTSRVQ